MASITSAGVGSGLDVATIVAQLVAAERAPAETRLKAAQTKINAQISAFGSLKGSLSELQNKLKDLKANGALGKLTATSSKVEQFTATAGTAAGTGSYGVEVVSLAKAHKLVSAAYAGGPTTSLGAGTVQIGVGSESFTVTLASGADTLADLRSAINAASDNTGVTATLVNEVDGTRLLLTARETGAANSITVTSSLLGFTEKQAAADAHVKVEGYDHYSASNTVTGAIDGVTLQLLKAAPGDAGVLDVATDDKAAIDAVKAFVTAYNSTVGTIASLTKYDANTRKAAALNGDVLARSAQQSLRSVLGGAIDEDGALHSLAEIGITTQTDGTLKFDDTKLTAKLGEDRSAVHRLLAGSEGFAAQLDAVIEPLIGSNGQVKSRNEALHTRLKALDRQFDALDYRMEAREARFRAQFTGLDTLMAQMNTTSGALSQQLSSLANFV